MQRIDLDALEAALAKVPGKWEARQSETGSSYWNIWKNDSDECPTLTLQTNYGPDAGEIAKLAALAHNALPALLAELRELRARTTPEVIGEKHKDGKEWHVWDGREWLPAWWSEDLEAWVRRGYYRMLNSPTLALPMPGEPEGKP